MPASVPVPDGQNTDRSANEHKNDPTPSQQVVQPPLDYPQSGPEAAPEKSESNLIDASQPKPKDYVSTTATLLEAVDRISDQKSASPTEQTPAEQVAAEDQSESLSILPVNSDQDLRCAHCQAVISSDAQFCLECGRPTTTEPQRQLRMIRCYGGADRVDQMIPIEPGGLTIGRSQASLCIADDPYLSPIHLALKPQGDLLMAEDLGSFNGSFLRVRDKTEIKQNGEFLAGSQRFCFLGLGGPTSDVRIPNLKDTHSFGGEIPRRLFVALRLLHVGADGQPVSGSVFLRQGPVLCVGRQDCDLNFPDDTAMAPVHVEVHIGASGVHLVPKNSSTEVFVNLSGKTELHNGDELQVGAEVFRVEL